MATNAEMLLHKVINGWTVIAESGTFPGMTGGNFSSGYIVEKDGVKAFLKAMDLHRALSRGLNEVQNTVNQHIFEKNVLEFCKDKRLSGVIRLYESGEINFGDLSNPLGTIYYLIFELADGDIRKQLTIGGARDSAWKMRVLHQSVVAVTQLHGVEIAHQDVKPSNVLDVKSKYKLGDLGRCSSKNFAAPTDSLAFPGDTSYAPPEYHYGEIPISYTDKRLGSDAYLLGSLISFLFANGVGALNATICKLQPEFMPYTWTGTYQDVLPYLEKAHTEATLELKRLLPPIISDELSEVYFQLCHPNSLLRGHPDSRKQTGRPLGLNRYVSIFDRLTNKVKLYEKTNTEKVKNA